MPLYKIADVIVDMSPVGEDTASWYEPYLYTGDKEPHMTLTLNHRDIEYLLEEGQDFTYGTAENSLLSTAFNRKLFWHMGTYLHSSALLFDGRVYLFSGHSGVGKSTLTSRICSRFGEERAKVINDDKPSLRIIEDKCIVYGTPFAGGTSKQLNLSGELGAIVFLEQSDHNELVRLSDSEAIFRIMEQSITRHNQSIADRLLEIYSVVMDKYPIYKLFCTDSDEAVDAAIKITDSI